MDPRLLHDQRRLPVLAALGLGELTQDTTVTTSESVAAQPKDQVIYIRNSVQATVDAYDG